MDEQIIFYVDILGSKSAIDGSDNVRIDGLATLLQALAKTRGEAQRTEQETDSGHSVTIRPEISTFSDHVVLSHPLEHLKDDMLIVALMSADKMISALARAALELDMLIRGGATIGMLHHKDGVVIGRAMVEAWELESRSAIYPRVVMSRKLHSKLDSAGKSFFVLTDKDGITHFNYFRSMILTPLEPESSIKTWTDYVKRKVAANIERFEAKDLGNELGKWIWFKNTVDEVIGKLPPEILA